MFYDKEGNEITFEQFCDLSQDTEYVFHLVNELPDGTRISTKWFGIDGCNFETMVFPAIEVYGRCWTEGEARAMHALAVIEQIERVKKTYD